MTTETEIRRTYRDSDILSSIAERLEELHADRDDDLALAIAGLENDCRELAERIYGIAEQGARAARDASCA